ncbi:alpha/beta-hydrolase [Tricholoma matsutake]|nr:alpha/beta-hydrolase [Tricholoma matsutake 945]
MDPQNPNSFHHKTERLSTGRVYHFVDQVPENFVAQHTTTLLCLHGFPDLWYGWRYQIGPWVRQGFRVVVPDMLGYGGTDKPADSSEYSTRRLCADMAALLDLLAIHKAVLIGHDWGSFVGGRFALWHPDRLSALIMMSVPYTPPPLFYVPPEEIAKQVPEFGYQVYFATQESTLEIEHQLHKFLSMVFRPPGAFSDFTALGSVKKLLGSSQVTRHPSVLTDAEFQYYHTQLSKGMNGPLNYYRTGKFRYDEEHVARLPSNLRSSLPVLAIWGTSDCTATPAVFKKARKFIRDLQEVALEDKGHWVLVEAQDEVTEKVSSWLLGLSLVHGKL